MVSESENPYWLKPYVIGNEPLRQTIALTIPHLQPPLSSLIPPNILSSLIRHPEPLPSLDYGLFRLLLEVRGWVGQTPQSGRSAWEALTDARHEYYKSHSKFHSTYTTLLSNYAEAQILAAEENKLYACKLALVGAKGEKLSAEEHTRQLVLVAEAIKENAKRMAGNAEAMKNDILKLKERERMREKVTESLAAAKSAFLMSEGQDLVQLGKELYLSKKRTEGAVDEETLEETNGMIAGVPEGESAVEPGTDGTMGQMRVHEDWA